MTDSDEATVERLRDAWMDGGPARPLIEELMRLNRMEDAGHLARLALEVEGCEEREELERLLEQTGNPPPGWAEALAAFSRNPSPEKWDELMQFTPLDVLYRRTRNALRTLRRLGVDSDTLFRCATRDATFPEAFDLVESGEVLPETVLERAERAPRQTRALWLGLAAEAAFARGDEFGTVRLLKMAYAAAKHGLGPEMSVNAIRSRAGDRLHEMLDKIGVPREATALSSFL